MKTICLWGICLTKTAIVLQKDFTKYVFWSTPVWWVWGPCWRSRPGPALHGERNAKLFTNEWRSSVCKHHRKGRQRQMEFQFPLFLKGLKKFSFVPLHSCRMFHRGAQSNSVPTPRKLCWMTASVDEAKEPEHFLLIITSSCWPAKNSQRAGVRPKKPRQSVLNDWG